MRSRHLFSRGQRRPTRSKHLFSRGWRRAAAGSSSAAACSEASIRFIQRRNSFRAAVADGGSDAAIARTHTPCWSLYSPIRFALTTPTPPTSAVTAALTATKAKQVARVAVPGVWTGWHEAPADSTLRQSRRLVDLPPTTAVGQKAWGPPARVAERQWGCSKERQGDVRGGGETDGWIGRQRGHNRRRRQVKWRRRSTSGAAPAAAAQWASAHSRATATDVRAAGGAHGVPARVMMCRLQVCACPQCYGTQTFLHEWAGCS